MPKVQLYETFDGKITLNQKEYLDYLRARRRERMSWGRLVAYRARLLDEMEAIRGCSSLDEITDFLNRHGRHLMMLTGRHTELPFDFDISIKEEKYGLTLWDRSPRAHPYDGNDIRSFPVWEGSLSYRTRFDTVCKKRDTSKDHFYDIPRRRAPFYDLSDVLRHLGIQIGGGSGISTGANSDGTGHMRYNIVIWQSDFDHMRVLRRLAA